MKSILLAAGFGTRLRPITDNLPKPLVPILNQPLLFTALSQLKSQGFGPFAMNVHHLPEKLEEFAKLVRPQFGSIEISHELPFVLGTGGALEPLKGWIGDDDFLVYNGDILSGIDFFRLRALHRDLKNINSKNIVTMSVRPDFMGKDRSVWIDGVGDKNHVCGISKIAPVLPNEALKAHNFACAYIASPRLLDYIPKGQEVDLINAFNSLISDGFKIGALVDDSFWADVGTPQAVWETTVRLLERSSEPSFSGIPIDISRLKDGKELIGSGCSIDPSVKLVGYVVVGEHSSVGAGAEIKNSILFPGTEVSPGRQIDGLIIGPQGVEIKIDTII